MAQQHKYPETTKEVIRHWLARAKDQGAARMLVVWDSELDYDCFVFVHRGGRAQVLAGEFVKNSKLRVMECYDPALDFDEQLNEHRAFHW